MNAIETPTENLTRCQPTTIRKFCTKRNCSMRDFESEELRRERERENSVCTEGGGKKMENKKSDVCGKKSLKGTLTCTELS